MRVLIVSAPFGAGHHQAGVALVEALAQLRLATRCALTDLRTVPALRTAASAYHWGLRHAPRLWQTVYRTGATPEGQGRVAAWAAAALRRELAAAVTEFSPRVVVATHPFPAAALARLRREGVLTAPLAVVVTDFLPHPAWVHSGVDHYFVAPVAARERLCSLGVPTWRISETGIPVSPRFAAPAPRPAGGPPRLLLMGGGFGLGPLPQLVADLLRQGDGGVAVEVVTGGNRALWRRLSSLTARCPALTVCGQSDDVDRRMRRADLLLGKPGGLTCSEALASELPLLMVGAIPGQEVENAAVLAAAGAGLVAAPGEAAAQALRLVGPGQATLAALRAAAGALGRPRAALDAAAGLLALAGVPLPSASIVS